jgi:hypothetical protein
VRQIDSGGQHRGPRQETGNLKQQAMIIAIFLSELVGPGYGGGCRCRRMENIHIPGAVPARGRCSNFRPAITTAVTNVTYPERKTDKRQRSPLRQERQHGPVMIIFD